MNRRDIKNQLYDQLKQIVENVEAESLLETLKEKAHNVEIDKRGEFENVLLSLAQEKAGTGIRPVLYEAMVSLESIWNKDQPKRQLQDEFWTAIKVDQEKAAFIYKELVKQGLDYTGTIQKGRGELIPLITDKEYLLLQYNSIELTFYNLKLEQSAYILIPGSLEIIDVITPSPFKTMESTDLTCQKDLDGKIWLLLDDDFSKRKSIIYIKMEEICSVNINQNLIEQRVFYLNINNDDYTHLSYFQGRFLIVSNHTIYYEENNHWIEWYTSENEITAFESTRKGFWVGHSDGEVLILKSLEHVGVRDTFKEHTEAIKVIRRVEDFVLVFCKDCLCVADHAGNLVLKDTIKTDSEIIQSTILNNEFVLIHMVNGMLTARELKQGNLGWQINLGDTYETLFAFRQYVFCGKKNGETKIFEIPLFDSMAKALENKNIYVDSQTVESGPYAPVRYISEFIGRRKLLDEIKNSGRTHFVLYGEPRIGKTSLLHVLRDTLSESAKCCFIDMAQLLKDAGSYEKFEEDFINRCLMQHFMDDSELSKKEGYHAFRALVKKIKGDRKFCVFCLDNFFAPVDFDEEYLEKFKSTFLRSLLIHPDVRFVLTCSSRYKDKVVNFFDGFKDIFRLRKLLYRPIPFFSETEVKNALRKKVAFDQYNVNEIYKYVGRFPHLVHLYDKWNVNQHSITEQSKLVAKEFSEKIFEYFRDLSPDAHLLIATSLKDNLLSVKNSYETFYENFPFLKSSLPRPQLTQALDEINSYGDGFFAESDGESFYISCKDNAQLLYEASKQISWLNAFSTLYKFTSAPDHSQAYNVALTFTKITGSALDSDVSLDIFMEKYKKVFYVNKLTEQGQLALDMPLTTFIVIPLKPWQTDSHKNVFNDLYVSIQEFERLSGKFYILLFELHGTPAQKIKDDLVGLERISVIDAPRMKSIILDKSPREKASEYIFDQLSIKERSPYTTSGAVPDELFYGREMEIQLIRGLPENIGIFGTRTIGKTSLLRRFNKDIKSYPKWKVYAMDCSQIKNEESLLNNLAEKIGIPFEEIPDMEEFRKYVTREAQASGQQYLFLLDEVDRLVQYDIEHEEKIFNTLNRLSTETMDNDEYAARFILCGFDKMFEQMKNPGSRLYNFMVFLPLKPLDVASAKALVTNPIEKIRVRWNNKEDASYLVDNCSGHPRLLQAACHSLLTILDDKTEKKDVIERSDVDLALTSDKFREMCMRFYQNPQVEKEEKTINNKNENERIIVEKKKAFFTSIFMTQAKEKKLIQLDLPDQTHQSEPPEKPKKGTAYWNDLHRIAILSAIRLLFEERMYTFSIMDIQRELKKLGLDISPNVMRIILDHLCLSSNFRLKTESTLIARKDTDVRTKVGQDITVEKPDDLLDDKTLPKFIYEFGVKIFPKLLVAHFGGINQCKNELKTLIEKKDWREWLRRY